MKKKELNGIIESLVEVSDLKGVKFAYTVIKNKKKIEEELNILQEATKPTPEFEEFEKKRIDLCAAHSEIDDSGNPIIENNKYKIKDIKLFEVEFEKLKSDNADVVTAREKQIEEYQILLEEDTDITFDKVQLNDLPIDITAAQIDAIDFMIKWQ